MPQDVRDRREREPDDGRDRRADGRPEQARPRDRTGRPLPYGTEGIPLTEEHDPVTVEDALALGVSLWNERRFFEAHECLEHVWHAAPADDADFWQGVIQVAVGGVHLQRENAYGATTLLDRAARRLAGYPDRHRGVEVAALRAFCAEAVPEIADGRADDVVLPRFPASPEGAWFARDPAAQAPHDEPTPIPTDMPVRSQERRS